MSNLQHLDCAAATRARYQVQIDRCERHRRLQARLTGKKAPKTRKASTFLADAIEAYPGPQSDLVIGTAEMAATIGTSDHFVRCALKTGVVEVYTVPAIKHGPARLAVRREDVERLLMCRQRKVRRSGTHGKGAVQ